MTKHYTFRSVNPNVPAPGSLDEYLNNALQDGELLNIIIAVGIDATAVILEAPTKFRDTANDSYFIDGFIGKFLSAPGAYTVQVSHHVGEESASDDYFSHYSGDTRNPIAAIACIRTPSR